jgi:hypothetical protein
MAARIAADAVMIVHLAFVLFVVLGGLLAVRDLRFAWVHLPAVAWGVYVEFAARVCPLTPLENRLRRAAGEAGYEGGFIEHYVTPLVYPAGLTSAHQFWLGVAIVAFNVLVYFVAVSRWRRLG